MGKFCEYCGTPLKDGANFCTGCGKVALIVFLVLLVVLGVGGYFLYDMAKDKIEEVNSKSEETVERPAATQKTPSTSKTKLKYEMFFNVAIPIPDFGVTTTSKAVVSTLNRKNHEKNNHYHLFIDYVCIWLFPGLVSF